MNDKKKLIIKNFLKIFASILFAGNIIFLVYYLGIQPYYSKQVNNKYRDLYYSVSNSSIESNSNILPDTDNKEVFSLSLDIDIPSGAKNSDKTLIKFNKLKEVNSDVKGWLKIPSTNIDYPVMQSYNGSNFYLKHDFEGTKDKNGCLYLQGSCNIKPASKNMIIHGHNMDSTGMMFHELLKYKDIEFYKANPIITFDTLYRESNWKIIAYMRVSGDLESSGMFNYMQSSFETDEEFLDFLYQIEMRSSYSCPVDVNEHDNLLMLSTCSYEISNYRTVVVARRLRKGESLEVDTSSASYNTAVLYPSSWYSKYGGEKPIATSFENAMSFKEISWYDGDVNVNQAVGSYIEYENCNYEILSNESANLASIKNYKIKDFSIPATIKYEGRNFKVVSFNSDVFEKCTKLESIKIGNNIVTIPSRAFMKCVKLKKFTVGVSVESIGKKAFYKLENLKNIKIKSLVLKDVGERAFDKINKKAKFKYPKRCEKKYEKLIFSLK